MFATYMDELSEDEQVLYKQKLVRFSMSECPYRLSELKWTSSNTGLPDVRYENVNGYLNDTQGTVTFYNCI